jgi:hypothetical protein
MHKKLLLYIILFIASLSLNAQVTDNFNDGDYTNNPTWTGNGADWIVNPAFQLQSNNTAANSTFYISTPNTLATVAQWDFYSQLAFNPSSANYVDVFLIASANDISAIVTTGYFVRIGNTDDEISLWRKDGAVTAKIIDGTNGILNTGNNSMKIRVVRNAADQWSLSRDITGTGNNYVNEGVVTDATYTTSSFSGILVKQSTASFFQKHFFDDMVIAPYVPDVTPPAIISATAAASNTLDVLFNEAVDFATSQQAMNYSASNGIGTAATAVRDAANPSLVHLSFANNFPGSTILQLTVNGVMDLSNNTLTNGTATFSFFTATQYDVVIDEIMADPTPVTGLPDAEWIELKNTTAFDINLQGWSLGKAGSQSGPMPAFILKADSFVVVTTGSAVTLLAPFGPAISVGSFPSLNNTGDLLYLRSPQGIIVHAVEYADSWYRNELKKAGGWTLEMIDVHNPCSGSNNWKASVNASGGTPAKKNAVDGANADPSAPKLVRAYAPDSVNIVLVFDEPLDSTNGAAPARYNISDGIGIPLSAIPVSILFDRVHLKLATALLRNKIYTVTAAGITDCSGNTIGTANTARVGLYEHTDSFDIVVNEILFNPKPNGVDYAELYNRTNKILNLKNVYIANRSSGGNMTGITQLSPEDYLLFPREFIVITEDADAVKRDFIAQNPNAFIQLSALPSFNDDKGSVILLNEQGNIIDEVNYSEKWHFKLISNNEGVALERIDYDAPSNNPVNWHSAATNIGYGTPTYKNSQYRMDADVKGTITVTPEIFSPDNDGIDDFATIDYIFAEPGYVSNITVFDASGRPVRYLQRNALSGTRGFYRWDGLDEKNKKLPVGLYIVYTEIFNLQGKTKKFKNTIVLARRQ